MGFAEIDNDAIRVGGVLKKCGQVIAGGKKQLAFDGVIGNLLAILILYLAAYINKVRYSAHKHHAGSKDTHDHTDGQIGRCYDHSDGNEHDGGLALGHALERGWLNRMPIKGADGDHDHDGYQGVQRDYTHGNAEGPGGDGLDCCPQRDREVSAGSACRDVTHGLSARRAATPGTGSAGGKVRASVA